MKCAYGSRERERKTIRRVQALCITLRLLLLVSSLNEGSAGPSVMSIDRCYTSRCVNEAEKNTFVYSTRVFFCGIMLYIYVRVQWAKLESA